MQRLILFAFIFFILSTAFAQDSKLANEYFQNGEFEKARVLYKSLANDRASIPLIHANYFNLLISAGSYLEAEKYLNIITKYYPDNMNYQAGYIKLYTLQQDPNKAKKQLQKLVQENSQNAYQLNLLGQALTSFNLYDEAIATISTARAISGRRSQYALDLASIHRLKGDKSSMIKEYLIYADENPYNLAYIKNILQSLLEDDDLMILENELIRMIQINPDQPMYSDLLIWLEIQQKNFKAAFIQGRAIDRRLGNQGTESIKIGQIAFENEAWDEAIEIFSYVSENYPEGPHYSTAKRYLIKSREEKTKNTYPVDIILLAQLAKDYQTLYLEIGINALTLEALQNKARLHAFYLNQKDSAIQILNFIINNRRTPSNLVASAKLDLGDIYILTEEPWESTLLYSQVEKANKESPIAFEAKLKNARLQYFLGNFSLAKSHLDILKLATTREIANDALSLSVLIQNNTAFDSTDAVMMEYANIELLIYQNFRTKAETRLNNMLENYPKHSLTDEIHWQLSELAMQRGDFLLSMKHLDFIIYEYGYDILNDDAFFKKGILLEKYLAQPAEALEVFTEFLKAHPGSMYAADARNHIRTLRGDFVN